ncbi:MAG: nucleotidyltransferase family protein [Deltaproteobacteria bacterium]|nr:MAG: nucleotidyltransferase family protein [Deltaproteobacteria bacterium]
MTQRDMEKILVEVLSQHNASRIAIFGSRARGEEHAGSDLDVLVSFSQAKSLLKMVAIERELSQRLGIKVDLLTEAAISPHLRERIQSQLKILLQ